MNKAEKIKMKEQKTYIYYLFKSKKTESYHIGKLVFDEATVDIKKAKSTIAADHLPDTGKIIILDIVKEQKPVDVIIDLDGIADEFRIGLYDEVAHKYVMPVSSIRLQWHWDVN